jgi:hypothetical protein
MGWYVRPGMGSKKAMASRVGTGDLDGQRRYQFASHAAREGDGGVRTISTGSLSWLNFFDCAWYVAVPTWNGGCTDGYIEPLEHAARKAAFAHLPSRSCTLAARGFVMPPMQKDGGRALLQRSQTVRAPAPVRTPLQRAEPGARSGSKSCGKPPVVQRRGPPPHACCPRTPSGSQAARVICALCALHTHPTVAPQRLVIVERSC